MPPKHDRKVRELAVELFDEVTYNFLRTLTAG